MEAKRWCIPIARTGLSIKRSKELLLLCWFLDAGNKEARHAQLTGVQKAPRHEVAGSWAPIVRRSLWGFNVGADVDDVGDVSLMPAGYLRAREIGRVREELRRSLGSDRGAIRTLTDAIGFAAGAGPAYRK